MTAYNTPTVVPSEMGRAVFFDDNNSEYCAHEGAAPVASMPFTWSCWCWSIDAPTEHQTLLWLGDKDVANQFYVMRQGGGGAGSEGKVSNLAYAGVVNWVETTTTMTANTWHMVTGVFGGTSSVASFLDAGGKNTGTGEEPTGEDSVAIGRSHDSTPGTYWNGCIAVPIIWNRALTDLEVKWLYDEPWSLFAPRRRTYIFMGALGGVVRHRQFGFGLPLRATRPAA